MTQVSERLKQCVRHCDTVARLCGDEFVIILEGISVVDEADVTANRILEAMSEPFNVEGREILATLTIGISFYPFGEDDIDTLTKNAETAMYQAKGKGRNTYRIYNPDIEQKSILRFSLESALRRALDKNEFELHYQPMIQLKSEIIFGMEALLRWKSPDRGMVSPLEFIPLLEDTGLILPVGQWVLETACTQCAAWQQQHNPDLKINVNVSAKQFLQESIVHQVSHALDSSDLKPHFLNLEITESLLIENSGNSLKILDRLNEMGVSLSIDDFGTGYSSMSYLKRMPIETVKIDKSFVQGIPSDLDDAAIIEAICALSRTLRLNVIAEGVENQDQLKHMINLGIFAVQGYLICRPAPPAELESLLGSQTTSHAV